MLWVGIHANCWWTFIFGEVTTEDWDTYCKFIAEKSSKVNSLAILNCIYQSTGPTIEQLEEAGRHSVQYAKGASFTTKGLAFCSDNLEAMPAVHKAIVEITRPYPVRVFADLEKALSWLGLVADIESNEVYFAMEAACGQHMWKVPSMYCPFCSKRCDSSCISKIKSW